MGRCPAAKLALACGRFDDTMKREHLFKLFDEAHRLTGHKDYVVVGSLSILGTQDEEGLPAEMSMANNVSSYTKADPGRINDVSAALGEGSAFHKGNGYYLDPVSPHLPTLPDGWQNRLTSLNRGQVTLWFLDPDDAAMSKYARSAPNDLRWIRAGILCGLISLPKIKHRLASTTFLDGDEESRVRKQVDATLAWFEVVKSGRLRGDVGP
jgi:hypothetical protein